MKLEQGRIVWAELPSSDGRSRKCRPAVILTRTDQIRAGSPFVAVAITTTFPDPPPDDHVLLPWHPNGAVRTRLNRPCAAACSWLVQITESDVMRVGGVVPPELMRTIVEKAIVT